jgi:hypothetical protein
METLKNEIKNNKTVKKVSWINSGPVCKSSKLILRSHNGDFGFTTKNTLEYDNGGAVFGEKCSRFTELTSYSGSSITSHEVYISKEMASVLDSLE